MNDLTTMKSNYLNFLPFIFRGLEEDKAVFFERFLKIFEKFLTGIDDSKYLPQEVDYKSLAEILDSISSLFYPGTTSEEFVDWLSSWVGLVLKEDWSANRKKDVLKNIIPLYRLRGTKKGIEEFMKIYLDSEGVQINELKGFTVGMSTMIGSGTIIGVGMIPYFFVVNIELPEINPEKWNRRKRNIRNLLNAEKPIHTNYLLNITIPTLQVGIKSVVGKDTLLGGKLT